MWNEYKLDADCILLGEGEGHALFSHSDLRIVQRLQRPGIIIFVHGVNSDGEWYEQAEAGLWRAQQALQGPALQCLVKFMVGRRVTPQQLFQFPARY